MRNTRVIVCCPMITCKNNTSDEPKAGGYCTSKKVVVFEMIEAKSFEYNYHYRKMTDVLVCTGYEPKRGYEKLVSPIREPEGEE